MITKTELLKRVAENESIIYDLEDRVIKLEKQIKKINTVLKKGKDE